MLNKKLRIFGDTNNFKFKYQNSSQTINYHLHENQVFMLPKKNQKENKSTKKVQNEKYRGNLPHGQFHQRNSIQCTIKQLLKGKEEISNYLESEKQFITIIGQDRDQAHCTKNGRKLASSLTSKKKSRIQVYPSTKNKFTEEMAKSLIGNKWSKSANSHSLALQPLQKDEKIEKNSERLVSARYYEKNNRPNPRSNQKQKDSSPLDKKAGLQKPSFEKKKQKIKIELKKKENVCFEENTSHPTKFRLTSFSPWAHTKNEIDLDLAQSKTTLEIQKILSYQHSSQDKAQIIQKKLGSESKSKRNKLGSSLIRNTNTLKIKKDQNSMQTKCKIHAKSVHQNSPKQNQQSVQQIFINKSIQKDSSDSVSRQKHLVKSSVVILQSVNTETPKIFTSKQYFRQGLKNKKFIENQIKMSSLHSSMQNRCYKNRAVIEHKQKAKTFEKVSILNQEVAKDQKLITYSCHEQLTDINKTEEFLKQIRFMKNFISNSKNQTINTKEPQNAKQIESKDTKKHCTYFMLQKISNKKIDSQHATQTQHCSILLENQSKLFCDVLNKQFQKSKGMGQAEISQDKQNQRSKILFCQKKKAQTSFDHSTAEKKPFEIVSNSNTKSLTEVSLDGLCLIHESRIQNCQNSFFLPRKRHSMVVRKKKYHECRVQEQTHRKKSCSSSEKQIYSSYQNQNPLNLLEGSKGFQIVNPLAKNLYKKYANIVQNKRA